MREETATSRTHMVKKEGRDVKEVVRGGRKREG